MTKEEKKVAGAENIQVPQSKPDQEIPQTVQNESTPAPVQAAAVDPAIQNAINQAVAGAVSAIMEKLMQPSANLPALNTAQPQASSHALPPMRQPIAKLKGIPVEEGQDLRHVPAWRINEWFRNIELNAQKRVALQGKAMQAEMSWTRG